MEIVFRAAVIYLFLWLVTRALGRATLGELSTFQLVLYVAMGDLVQQGVTQQDYSITGAVLAISTFAVLTAGVSLVQSHWPRTRPFTHGTAIAILRDGQPDLKALSGEQMSVSDLFASAREQGIRRLAQIELAVLEADGRISFFTRELDGDSDQHDESGAPEKPNVG
ncbi:DUF421 domain-containing protein [Spongisporangium articulatum]|uniref:DUF421 domain-containing protein n=1 Tax=Spongisporangium articulatum TaxID=3362603 RepID=A0ABW8ALL8_9ACTN